MSATPNAFINVINALTRIRAAMKSAGAELPTEFEDEAQRITTTLADLRPLTTSDNAASHIADLMLAGKDPLADKKVQDIIARATLQEMRILGLMETETELRIRALTLEHYTALHEAVETAANRHAGFISAALQHIDGSALVDAQAGLNLPPARMGDWGKARQGAAVIDQLAGAWHGLSLALDRNMPTDPPGNRLLITAELDRDEFAQARDVYGTQPSASLIARHPLALASVATFKSRAAAVMAQRREHREELQEENLQRIRTVAKFGGF